MVSTASTWQKNSRRARSARRQWRSNRFVVSDAPRQPDSRQRFTSARSALTRGRSSLSSSASNDSWALPVRSLLYQ